MTEQAIVLHAGFSVADAEYPDFALCNGTLSLKFIDWQKHRIEVEFSNVAGIRWQELDSDGPEERNDEVFEIIDSSWVDRYIAEMARTKEDNLRHFKLFFNACGVLEVLASEMQVKK
jgi:hypothetical protein